MKSYHDKFMEWVKITHTNVDHFNPSSTHQLQQLLFAPFDRIKTKVTTNKQLDPGLEQLDFCIENTKNENKNDDENENEDEDEPKRKMNRKELDHFPITRAFIVPNDKVFYHISHNYNFLGDCSSWEKRSLKKP